MWYSLAKKEIEAGHSKWQTLARKITTDIFKKLILEGSENYHNDSDFGIPVNAELIFNEDLEDTLGNILPIVSGEYGHSEGISIWIQTRANHFNAKYWTQFYNHILEVVRHEVEHYRRFLHKEYGDTRPGEKYLNYPGADYMLQPEEIMAEYPAIRSIRGHLVDNIKKIVGRDVNHMIHSMDELGRTCNTITLQRFSLEYARELAENALQRYPQKRQELIPFLDRINDELSKIPKDTPIRRK